MSPAASGRPATMADLARIAGVSITTVSHALNQTRYVSDEARRKVYAAIEETGYTQNIIARSMKTSVTNTIGLAAPALSKVALADLVRPIEAEARARSLSLLFTDTEDEAGPELAAVQSLHGRRVDGIIIAPSAADSPGVAYLRDHAIPTVVIDRFTTPGVFDQIGTQNIRPMHELAEHLIVAGGHTRLAMVNAMPNLSTTAERIVGFRRALAAHDLPFDEDLVRYSKDDPAAYLPILESLLNLPDPPTGLVSGNSATTIGIMRAAGALGVRVPTDLALVGFDDFEWADVFHPRLTVMRQRTDEIGNRAVHLLQDRIVSPDGPVRTYRVAADFIHRDSCGCHVR